MINLYCTDGTHKFFNSSLDIIDDIPENIVWIDLIRPTKGEIAWTEENYHIVVPELDEQEVELGLANRYKESDYITINSHFNLAHVHSNHYMTGALLTIIIKKDLLITVRSEEMRTFDIALGIFANDREKMQNPYDILLQILDIRINLDSDEIEKIVMTIYDSRNWVLKNKKITEELYKEFFKLETQNMRLRENLMDKQRIIMALVKSKHLPKSKHKYFNLLLDDIHQLVNQTEFSSERIDSIQDISIGIVNIEQNEAVKIFTIVSVIFMPPTLIASIYGMNFEYMPELKTLYGYPTALVGMIVSAMIPLFWFKKKGWL